MSFKLFIYYCAVCGGWAAFAGWLAGWGLTSGTARGLGTDLVQGLFLGLSVALALAVLDAVWNMRSHRYEQLFACGLFATVAGTLAGLVGAGFGHLLVGLTHNAFCYILGWTLVGLLIGVSVGLYDFVARLREGDHSGGGIRKVLNGLFGGGLGGFCGGLLFVAIAGAAGLFGRELRSGSALGFVVLGGCIGLLIGLAQVILKEAWVKVEAGRRAGREVLLSREETTIGRAEACDIGLFGEQGIEKLHARIVLGKGGYLLADADTPGGTYLNDRRIDRPTPLRSGDAIRVGGCVLRFGERRKRN